MNLATFEKKRRAGATKVRRIARIIKRAEELRNSLETEQLKAFVEACTSLKSKPFAPDPEPYQTTWFLVKSFRLRDRMQMTGNIAKCEPTSAPDLANGQPAAADAHETDVFKEVVRRECPKCHGEGLVVGKYSYAYRGCQGDDIYELTLFVLCPTCLKAIGFARNQPLKFF